MSATNASDEATATCCQERRRLLWQVWTVVLVCVANMGYVGLATSNVAATAMIDGLPGWTKQMSGDLLATGTVGTALGSLLMGPVSDWLGGRRVLLFGMLVSIGCNVAMSQLSTGLRAAMYSVWFVNTFLYGSAWGAYSRIVGAWLDKQYLGTAWALVCVSWSGSVFFFAFLLGVLLQHDVVNWSGVFVFQACFGAAVLLLLFACLYEAPHEDALRPSGFLPTGAVDDVSLEPMIGELTGDNDDDSEDSDVDGVSAELAAIQKLDRSQCLAHFAVSPHYWCILTAYVCFSLLNELGNWLPFVLQEVWRLDAGHADSLSSLNSLGATVGLLTVGLVFDRLAWRTVVFAVFVLTSLTALALLALSVCIEAAVEQLWLLGLLFFLFGFAMTVPYNIPPCIYPIKYGGPRYTASISGVFDGVGNLAAIFVDFVAGRLGNDEWPYLVGAAALCAIVAIVCQTTFHWLDRPTQPAVRQLNRLV